MYSYSKIYCYVQCPLKYKFKYIDGIKTVAQYVQFHLGKSVHKALEKLYSDKMRGHVPSLEGLLAYYENTWYSGVTPEMIIPEGNRSSDFLERGSECLRYYYEENRPFDEDETLAVEKKVFFKIAGRPFIGYVDRLSLKDGKTLIHDYKTTLSEEHATETVNDFQMPLYQIALSNEFSNIELRWHFLTLKKVHRATKTEEEISEVNKEITSLLSEIESKFATDFNPSKGEHCECCEYRKMCPAWK